MSILLNVDNLNNTSEERLTGRLRWITRPVTREVRVRGYLQEIIESVRVLQQEFVVRTVGRNDYRYEWRDVPEVIE